MTAQRVSRREVAKWLTFSCVAPQLFAACAHPRAGGAGVAAPAARSMRRLARVRVAENRVIRQVAGLRPFRRSGFRVEAASLGDKPLIHNYGHGGGGVSLSWGTAQLALEHALETPHRRAAVIG
ncbi:MAG: FAD-dependent oxidoreductase, partial [Gemmatimonadaceae bacterium]